MKQTLVIVALTALGTLVVDRLLVIPSVAAQEASGVTGFELQAGLRRDTDKNEGFIFYNAKTGDIWVYEDAVVKEHYRVAQVGQNLVKVPK